MHRRTLLLSSAGLATLGLGGCATPPPNLTLMAEQVRAAEIAFASTMGARDFAAFGRWIADDATFVNGGKPLRGKAAILMHWERFFRGPTPPFLWKPEIVEVLASGRLAYSEGPVSAPDGRVIARYASTWRLEDDGQWRVVLDNGHEVCDCVKKP